MNKPILKIIAITLLSILSVVAVFFCVTTVRFLWFRPVSISGNSMQPTLQDGQLIYVNTLARPKAGEVACFFYVPDPEGEQVLPSAQYYGANGYWRSMPIWGLRIPETYSNGYSIFVKRVVGVGGDTIELRAETIEGANLVRLYRNGQLVEDNCLMLNKYAQDETSSLYAQAYAEQYGMEHIFVVEAAAPCTVPEGCYYVLGDNRGASNDSRHFGVVQANLFIGTVRGK